MNYDGREFRGVGNSDNGQVDTATTFRYRQTDDLVWAEYDGGQIRFGTLVGTVDRDGALDFAYQHVDAQGEIRTGRCRSTPELLADGRIRLHERWRWSDGDRSSGESIIEEVFPAG